MVHLTRYFFNLLLVSALIAACPSTSADESPESKTISVKDQVVSLNNQSVLKMNSNDYSEALILLNQAIDLDPDYPLAYINRALIKDKLGDAAGAIEDCTKVIENNKSKKSSISMALIDRGNVKQRINDFSGALHDYDQALKMEPQNDHALITRGILYHQLKELTKAEQDMSKAIQIRPDNCYYYYRRARVRLELDNLIEAMIDINEAITLRKDIAKYHELRTLIRKKLEAQNKMHMQG